MNIAVAVDFSMESHFAVRWALDLRNRLRDRETPVNTFAVTIPADDQDFGYRTLAGLPTATTEDAGVTHQIAHHIRDFLESVDYDVDDVQIVLEEGDPSKVISRFCETHDIDWLVTGMNSSDALSRLVLGSTVHRLSEIAPCNLVVVHPEHSRLQSALDVAAGIDFLPGSETALFGAAALADVTGGHLHLVHALQEAPTGASRRGPLSTLDPEDMARLEADANESLDMMMDEIRRQHPELNYSKLIHSGSAKKVLINYIAEQDIDAVCLGKVHHSTFEKWFFGSVSRALLKKMPTTLVLVPPEEA